ncbi:adenosylcobinamide-phosphate synthase CbiB [Filifactor villosus]|uniref:Cobalamin biosynthesis protein CobD n=1 Tax=Filifactor villosus TaxID=29374 RepID=A0ABV9QKT0_9FIRM
MTGTVAYSLLIATLIDFVLGDPYWFPHPVIMMGRLIRFTEKRVRRSFAKNKVLGGCVLWFVVVGSSFATVFWAIRLAGKISPLLAFSMQTLLMWNCISTKCLAVEAEKVGSAVRRGDLNLSRTRISYLVGRDTTELSFAEILRATVETVAENTVDGTIAPMFFAVLGGAPLMVAYKACNTLDSMVGYKNEDYIELGRASALIDDLVNLIPARVSIALIALSAPLVGLNAKEAWRIGLRDRKNHLSPNSAHAEAAFAGALGVRLGGTNVYFGKKVEKPTIGDAVKELEAEDISRSNRLLFATTITTLLLFLLLREIGMKIVG